MRQKPRAEWTTFEAEVLPHVDRLFRLAMCGVKHAMPDEAACTAACVKKGSDYALIVSGKPYTLKANEQTKAQLSALAGKQAQLVGDLNGTTLTVTSVKAAK